MKKVCSTALALLLALTMAVPVCASEQTITMPQTELSGGVILHSETPVVRVTVPQTGVAIINPYGLEVSLRGEDSTEQILSQVLLIKNRSEYPAQVNVSAVGSVQGNLVYTRTPPQRNAAAKEVFVYAEFQPDGAAWSGSYTNADNQVLITANESTPKEVLRLQGDSDGQFRLFGSVSVYPTEPWAEGDGISVLFTFTFNPITEENVSLSSCDEPDLVEVPEQKPEEPPAEEPPAEEPPAEEPPAEDPPAEEPPAEEPPVEEPPVEEPPAEEPPAEEPSVEEPPAEEPPAEEPPVEDNSETEDTPTEDPPVTPEESSPAPDSELPEEPEN